MAGARYTRAVLPDHHDPRTEGLAHEAGGTDPEAFERLVERIQGRLSLWIGLRLGPRLRARVTDEDVLQDTLLHAYRSLDSFRDHGPGSFLRWMLSVAEHRIKDLHKFHSRDRRAMAREFVPAPAGEAESRFIERFSGSWTSPASAAHRREQAARVTRLIESLADDVREVVVLRAVEDRSFAEIADRIGRPKTTVYELYARGLRRLRNV